LSFYTLTGLLEHKGLHKSSKLSEIYILEWLLEGTSDIYLVFLEELWKFLPVRWGISQFSQSHTCPPKWESAELLDCLSWTNRLSFDEVAPKIPGSNTMWFLFMGHVKDLVYMPPFQENRYWPIEMTHFGTAASITADVLEQVWQDMDYRIDIYPCWVSVNYHTNFHSFSSY
jgi:hypothetical protein